MSDATLAIPLKVAARVGQVFPTLTATQIARIAAHGRKRQLQPGEVLLEVGDQVRFFLVTAGKIEIFSVSGPSESLVATLQPGQFTGEVNLLSGRRAFTRIRASETGEVIELEREELLDLLQTDSELSDIFMRAFILRRVELIVHGLGDAVLVGSTHSPDTLRIKEFLTRNGHPHAYIDLDRDKDVQHLLDRFHVGIADIPVVICRGQSVLRNPTNQQIADCLGFNEAIDRTHLRDLVVVSAGPAGLAAGRLWRVGRIGCAGAGIERAGWASGLKLEDRELSWFSDWHFGTRPCRPRLHAGAKIRCSSHDREVRQTPRMRPKTLRD